MTKRSPYGDLFFKETAEYHRGLSERPQPIDFVLHYFNDASKLFYIDIGANDGVTCSNSYALEKYLKWDGICIEPNPESFIKLSNARKCECINNCLSSKKGKVTFRSVYGYANMLSGILDFFDPGHTNRINEEIKNHGGSYEDIEIESKKLQDICAERNLKTINYISIDCEGAEYEILKGLDLLKFQPTLISIETENNPRSSDDKATLYLTENNYKLEAKVCGDSFFSKKH